jgi:hypothetical protein
MEAVPAHTGMARASAWHEVRRCEAEAIRRGEPVDVQIWASQMDEILGEFRREIDELERSVDDLASRVGQSGVGRICVSDGSRPPSRR